jgi:hypothetical protein
MRVRTDLYDCACGDPEWSDADNARDAENWATDQRRPDETPRVIVAVTVIRDGSGALMATVGREKTDEIAAIAAQVPGAAIALAEETGAMINCMTGSAWVPEALDLPRQEFEAREAAQQRQKDERKSRKVA